MKKVTRMALMVALAVVLTLLLLVPYGVVEVNTIVHGQEFSMEYEQIHMICGIEYFKVLSWSPKTSTVFYVVEEHVAGIKVRFVNEEGEWKVNSWSTVWSTTGSADRFMWPYYR